MPKTKTDLEAASAEILRRRELRRDLVQWCRHCGYEPAKHHRFILEHLVRVARSEIPQLALCLPPGAAKTSYVALFAPWYMANNPEAAIILASHTQELAEKQSRRVRNLIAEHSASLGIALSKETTAAERWALTSGGEAKAVGAGSAVVGARADLILIDDPLRGIEQAMSESEKQKLYDWYRNDITTRLRPGGKIVAIQTRWATDDLLGRLLEEEGDRWTLVSLPAEAEPGDPLGREIGEMLWSDQPSYDYPGFLAEQKRTQSARSWASLFQQRPVALGGNLFKESWLKTFQNVPDRATLKTYIAVDFATSEGSGDHTAIVAFGLDPSSDIYVLDVWRRQSAPDVSIGALLDMVRDWKPMCVVTESGQIKNALGPFLREEMNRRKLWVPIETIPSRHAKEIRAQAIVGRAAVRGLYLPAHADWLSDFKSEVLAFPSGRWDDVCDCLSLLGQLLSRLVPGQAVPEKPRPKILSMDPKLCSLTLTDLFEDHERHHKRGFGRIQ